MNPVSLLGLLALLGIAWAISYHRREVRLRPVLWGLALQFDLALIILREDVWSFVGMVLLVLLIVSYMLHERLPAKGRLGLGAMVTPVALVVGYLLTLLPSPADTYLLAAVVLFLIVNGLLKKAPTAQPFAGSLLMILGVAMLISRGIYGREIFRGFSDRVADFLNLSDYGARFLFGNLAVPEFFFTDSGAAWPGFGIQFAFKVLPTIVFFGGFMAVLYHLGLMQKVIESVSRFMRWTIGTSGAETLSCSANIFVGQTEAPLLIRPFLPDMTRSELLTIMVGGFATIAGGVLAGYIALGVPAGHLVAATVMSAPAALVVGKIIYPELEHSQTAGDVDLPEIEVGANVIEAATGGITDGLKLAVNVGAMLLGFIALIAVLDVMMNFVDSIIDGRMLPALFPDRGFGQVVTYSAGGMSPVTSEFTGLFPGSLQTFFGTLLRPLAWLLGVPWQDAAKVGNLLGIKLSLNEFVSYGTLGSYIQGQQIGERAIIIATYALCGFANFSSIGIQIGGLSALAPGRRSDLAQVGLKAMIGGALASWLTATIAGILL
jgi:CNT family concentrative nucleoside transporter